MDDNDPYGLNPQALANYVRTLGPKGLHLYDPYAKNIEERGLFGALLLDYVHDDRQKFDAALAQVGCTTVSPFVSFFFLLWSTLVTIYDL